MGARRAEQPPPAGAASEEGDRFSASQSSSSQGSSSEGMSDESDADVEGASTLAAAPRVLGDVRQTILDLASSLVGCVVDPEEPLMAAGLDSLASVELRNNLQEAFGLPLPATLAVDYPSVAAMASYIHPQLALPQQARQQRRRGRKAAAVAGAGASAALACHQLHCLAPRRPKLAPAAAAIVGFASQTAGPWARCAGPAAFLPAGAEDAVTRVPATRWRLDERPALYEVGGGAPVFGAFFPGMDVAAFDSAAFGLSDSEAVAMDPQQRMLMMLSWQAMQEATAGRAWGQGGCGGHEGGASRRCGHAGWGAGGALPVCVRGGG